ncbi:hypothetical protein DL95DRAFT_470347 [Leptodontidium sp. 2 PMI_412]|nr:hypothetical protein DL95DRAFT_470347 [Leptodontidium sp. 2 PMI_412]
MAASKGAPQTKPDVPEYSDRPDRPDPGSNFSGIFLDNIDYPDEELPAYTDEPVPLTGNNGATPHRSNSSLPLDWYQPPPDLLFSSHDLNHSEYRTLFPDYSTNANTLYNMIHEQAQFPPSYYRATSPRYIHHHTRSFGRNLTDKSC